MNDLILSEHKILVQEGSFELIGFEELKQKINVLGRQLLSIEVTPDNIQENKRLVAQVRKFVDGLNRERIDFKNQYLQPYKKLEAQVKEISNRVTDYENIVRDQIREIEEVEREEKQKEIEEIFNRRLRAYGDQKLFEFNDFIKPKYLNKSFSINKVEEEMVSWFESRNQDISALKIFAETSNHDYAEILNQYLMTQNVAETMTYFKTLDNKKESINKALEKKPKSKKKIPQEEYVLIRVKEKDKDRVGSLLTLSGIEFEVV